MSSEPSEKAKEIPVTEGAQETNPKDSADGFLEALDLEYSEAALFQLGGDYYQSEELPEKAVGKDNH